MVFEYTKVPIYFIIRLPALMILLDKFNPFVFIIETLDDALIVLEYPTKLTFLTVKFE